MFIVKYYNRFGKMVYKIFIDMELCHRGSLAQVFEDFKRNNFIYEDLIWKNFIQILTRC